MTPFVDLYADQGADFNHVIYLKNELNNEALNVAGYTVTSQLRRSHTAQNVSANIVCTLSDPEEGEITLAMPYTVTANLKPGRYVFDVLAVDEYEVRSRILEGYITVTPSVTK